MVRRDKIIKWVLVLSSFGVLFTYQNCSNVSLSKLEPQKSSASQNFVGEKSHLPLPNRKPARIRTLFIVDQSTSMARQRCPEELDAELESEAMRRGDIRACNFVNGVDPLGARFSLIEQYINELAAEAGVETDLKFAVLPFSGGVNQRPKEALGDLQKMAFLTPVDALAFNQELLNEHITDLQAMQANMATIPEFLGTSVPLPVIRYAKNLLDAEMRNLEKEAQLTRTSFQIFYISDGVFKPIQDTITRAKRVMGCADCEADPGHFTCIKNAPPGFNCSTTINGRYYNLCPWQLCNEKLPELVIQNFGDPEDNDYNKIVDGLKSLISLKDSYLGLSLNMQLIQLFPEEVAKFPWEVNNKDWNIYNGVLADFSEAELLEYRGGSIEGLHKPLGKGQDLHLEIDSFYAINLNTFVNEFNQLEVDSDGDGISDAREVQLGLDPLNPRTDGICLDSISVRFACSDAQSYACNPNLDYDGDGLNQCEELLLGTSDSSVDSDNDGVIDSHEILRGLNPLKNDYADYSSTDTYTAMDHFKRGVHPIVSLPQVLPKHQIDLRIYEEGSGQFPDNNENLWSSKILRVDARNVPSVPAKALFLSNFPTRKISEVQVFDPNSYLLSSRHLEGKNELLLLLRLRVVQEPERRIWFKKKIILDGYTSEALSIRLSDLEEIDVLDLVRK